jgi:hypothetical protein
LAISDEEDRYFILTKEEAATLVALPPLPEVGYDDEEEGEKHEDNK